MNLEFINPHPYAVQLPDPNRQIIQILPGQKIKLPEFYKRYCPKYIRLVGKNVNPANIQYHMQKQAHTVPKSLNKGVTQRRSAHTNTPSAKGATRRKNKGITPRKNKRGVVQQKKSSGGPAQRKNADINIFHIAVGILSCNRPSSLDRLLNSINRHTEHNISVYVSDESDKSKSAIRKIMGKYPWIRFMDNDNRLGIVGNTNRLLYEMRNYKFKLILNDDVEIMSKGWELFYAKAMENTGYHHFCHRQYGIYGAAPSQENRQTINSTVVKTITSKPQGAVMAFDDVAFDTVGYYDSQFPRYGMSHVDWSNRINNSKIQPPGFHDVEGSDKYFKVHDDKSATHNRIQLYKQAKTIFEKVAKNEDRLYIDYSHPHDASKICVLAISTYNRLDYLKRTIDSWNSTKNRLYKWKLIVADDGSDDGTAEYLSNLSICDVETYIIYNKRRGVHHQTNQILDLCTQINYDVGWKCDDDIVFKKRGWDDAYINAIDQTGYDHICFYDESWGKRRKPKNPQLHESGLLTCATHSDEVQGALWTFTPNLLNKIGFFDTDKFNLCGWGHTDFTFRCCKAGFNDIDNIYDISHSNQFISLIQKDYHSAPNKNRYKWNDEKTVADKKSHLRDDRIFVPYNEHNCNLLGDPVPKPLISFVIPLRGRKEHVPGLLDNINRYFDDYEIVFSEQDDENMFMRGQLCNLGFLQSHGRIIVFQDIDIRHLRPIDFSAQLVKLGRPYVAFNKISQLNENNNDYDILETKERLQAFGACAVFSRSQFIASHGFSNLIIGWGGEDNLMNFRVGFARVRQDLGHVKHDAPPPADIWRSSWHRRNVDLLRSDNTRDAHKDGYAQTIATMTNHECNGNIIRCSFKNIKTASGYAYKNLLKILSGKSSNG